MNSLKEKDNKDKQNTINQIIDRADKLKQNEEELKIQINNLEQALIDLENADIKLKEISSKQFELQKVANNQNDLSKMFNNVSGKNSKRADEWDELEKQKEGQLTILKEIRNKYGHQHTIERNIKELKYKQSSFNERNEVLQENIKNEENQVVDDLYDNQDCKIYYPYPDGQQQDKTNYGYHHIENCYKKFINDDNKLEMLHNIDNIYIKQHKKVQFIIDGIENNKSNIEAVKKKIESDKMKKDLEKELS